MNTVNFFLKKLQFTKVTSITRLPIFTIFIYFIPIQNEIENNNKIQINPEKYPIAAITIKNLKCDIARTDIKLS